MKKLLIPILLFALILSACGSTKDKIQGNWEDTKNEGYQVEIKDNVFEITQSGLTLKGKIEEDKDGNLKADIDGEKAKVDYQDDKLIIDNMKFKKID
ncbi:MULTISPECIES: hypothetical protein [Mammaliicoccus]|uniref:Lipoprotein n=1 Tax=Mammaliicoccus sciuri TaxID=1296 RepID=A0ABT7HYX2_MAMSC|nr:MULTISPECIES: hypothetical protein [Mammaliicoccus]MCJ1781462.1 hypothetical protein [Mammaliicoccus sciuri]MDL0112700.1 hypothetical protein [Mammaliicoccus sciuri]MDL0117180.1 hypothetical protein [Mammaliicoccus sciuri]WQJ65945.1 hypothetical protein P3T97_00620 [Mammaliicoccus sciuri]